MSATSVTALQEVANVRLMLQQQAHPGAKNPVTVCRQVIDCSIQQTKLISSRDNGPGIDTGDILCEGYLTRAALLPPATAQSNPWDWLAAEQAWQTPGLRATFQPLPVPPATEPPRPTAVQVPAEVIPLLTQHNAVQQRNLVYIGITSCLPRVMSAAWASPEAWQ